MSITEMSWLAGVADGVGWVPEKTMKVAEREPAFEHLP